MVQLLSWRSPAQEDIMYETLTPRENLAFAAAFILPKLSKEHRSKEVEEQIGQGNFDVGISIWHSMSCKPTFQGGTMWDLKASSL